MTLETIRDVLGRILSINKNINHNSLQVLLEASGWDSNDIKEGLRIFDEYQENGKDMSKVSLERIREDKIENNIQAPKVEVKKEENVSEDEINKTHYDPKDLGSKSHFHFPFSINLDKKEENDKKKEGDKKEDENKEGLAGDEDSKDIKKDDSLDKTKSEEKTAVPEHINTLEENVRELDQYFVHQRPWGLIIFNTILFVIILALLIYILLI